MRNPEQLRGLAEEYVRDLALTPELGALEDPIRYALEAGKRVRAVLWRGQWVGTERPIQP